MLWPSIIGQERVKRQLLDLISAGRLAHAYLFQGDEGLGKDAVAIQLARVLHCDRGGAEACGSCPSCLKSAKLQHPDIHFVMALPRGPNEERKDGPMDKLSQDDVRVVREQLGLKAANPYHTIDIPRANVIKLGSVRELRREVTLSTSAQKRRVVIISKAEDMNDESSNALLKTLEEPSTDTMFILTTAHPERLLPTIRSRCHIIRFEPLTPEEIQRRLESENLVQTGSGELIAHLSMGSYTRAQALVQENVSDERRRILEFVRILVGGNFVKLMSAIDELGEKKERGNVVRFLNLMTIWFRDALVLREGGSILNIDQKTEIQGFLTKYPNADLPSVLKEIEETVSLVERNGYIPLALVRLAIRLKRMILSRT